MPQPEAFQRIFKSNQDVESLLTGGQWRQFGETAILCCPDCGMVARLDHSISDAGKVSPSVQCAGKDCMFHDMVILEGWGGKVR